jgi:tetratricopeptide (TPR) repeat protein
MSITQNAPVNLQETADALEKWFLEERLRVSNAMLAHHRVYQKITYDHGFLEKAIAYMEDRKMLDDPSLAVYYYAYQAFKRPTEEYYFNNLEHLIHHEMGKFQHSEVRALYLAALNYCVPKINQGRHDFYQKAFDLYKKGIETGILIENGVLSRYTFLNAVSSALKTQEFDWAEKFIEQFQPFLEEKQRQGSVNFSLSRLYFERGDYDKAQQFLMQFEYDDMLQNIVAKTMLLKIYFERDDFDAFESLLESMRTYLQRKEALDPARKLAYKNMISMMKKLLHHDIFSKVQREKFSETIVKTHPLAEREWLLEQINNR